MWFDTVYFETSSLAFKTRSLCQMSVRSFTLLFVGNPSLELTQEVIVIINRSQRELFITGRNHTVSVNSVKNILYYFINRAGKIMSGIWRIGSIVLGYYCAINGQSKTLAFLNMFDAGCDDIFLWTTSLMLPTCKHNSVKLCIAKISYKMHTILFIKWLNTTKK